MCECYTGMARGTVFSFCISGSLEARITSFAMVQSSSLLSISVAIREAP